MFPIKQKALEVIKNEALKSAKAPQSIQYDLLLGQTHSASMWHQLNNFFCRE
jgi:hypothetical protein